MLQALQKFTFRGIMAPVLAPFDKNSSLNLNVIIKYAKFLNENAVKGVLVNGTTGEGMSLTIPERKILAETWLNATLSTNQHVMIQIGGVPLPYVLELAEHAERIGAGSILCLPELFYKPKSSTDLIRYLKIVGEAAPNTPLLYYNFPLQTGIYINMETFLNEAADQIPNLVGIKYSSFDLVEGMAAAKAYNEKFTFFLGANQILAGGFSLGLNSAIITTANIFPKLGSRILQLIKENNVEEARNVQDILTKACNIITKRGPWVPTMKVAMKLCTPIDVGLARQPLFNIKEEHVKEIEIGLRSLNLLQ